MLSVREDAHNPPPYHSGASSISALACAEACVPAMLADSWVSRQSGDRAQSEESQREQDQQAAMKMRLSFG